MDTAVGIKKLRFLSSCILMFLYLGTITCLLKQVNGATCETEYNCHLPDCSCDPKEPPYGINNKQIPPMVLFAYSGGVNYNTWDHLETAFPNKLKNSNDCPIAITVFVRGNFDACTVSALYDRGHEIATQGNVTGDWNGTVKHRTLIEEKSKIPEGHIVGVSAPDSKPGGDTQIELLSENGFIYDSSLILDFYQSSPSDPPYWPFTFSERFNKENIPKCGPNEICPKEVYDTFWEIPLGGLFLPLKYQIAGHSKCRFLGECAAYAENSSIAETLKFSYDRHFHQNGNYAPLVLNLRQNVFVLEEIVEDLVEFVRYLNEETDAYIITFQEALKWIKNAQNIKPFTGDSKSDEIDKGTGVFECPTRKLSGMCNRARFRPAGYFDAGNSMFWVLLVSLFFFFLAVLRYDKFR